MISCVLETCNSGPVKGSAYNVQPSKFLPHALLSLRDTLIARDVYLQGLDVSFVHLGLAVFDECLNGFLAFCEVPAAEQDVVCAARGKVFGGVVADALVGLKTGSVRWFDDGNEKGGPTPVMSVMSLVDMIVASPCWGRRVVK